LGDLVRLDTLDDLDNLALMPPTAIVVLTTVASAEEAVTLIRALLDRRLIACGNILPGVRSLYRWEGKVADEREVIVLLKTRASRVEALEMAFGELHPYKVPELLALPVSAGLHKYLEWIDDETSLALS
jgi:periplasmic divalent cation tolerance protein